MDRLDEGLNAVLIGNWEKDISCGGCHLYNEPFEKEASKKSWNSNPKFSLKFPENTPVNLKITLAIADKNWKSKNTDTVGGMIGIYLIKKCNSINILIKILISRP